MDEIRKLLIKMQKADRDRLRAIIAYLEAGQTAGLDVKKLKNSKLYRVRIGRYRIFFCYNEERAINVVTIRLRSEDSYRDI